MGYRVRARSTVDVRQATWSLRVLSAFASWPVITDSAGALVRPEEQDLPVQKALRELQARHAKALPSAVDAYVEALEVFEAHDAVDVFAAWRANRGGGAGYWPTEEAQRLRERVRAC